MFGNFGWPEILILGLLGLLIFGKRLPEVGKNLGKGIVEFKKGLSGVKDDLEVASDTRSASRPAPPPRARIEDQNAGRVSLDEELRATQDRLRAIEAELRSSKQQNG
ncbi:MAG: twin-arginine translocase TatA/TatE family subunit [Phycisphaeraceae bacterium]